MSSSNGRLDQRDYIRRHRRNDRFRMFDELAHMSAAGAMRRVDDDTCTLGHVTKAKLSPTEMVRAIAGGWGGDDDRDAATARKLRKLVHETAPKSLLDKLAAHGLDRASRISTAARLARVANDLATDPGVDGAALTEAFIATGASTSVALALGDPDHAMGFLRSRIKNHALDLSQLGLHGLPESIRLVPDVRSIDASHNRIRDMEASITELPRLRSLHLSYNGMSVVPDVVFELGKLEALALNDNRLTKLSERIGDLRELRDLWLSDNPLLELPRSMVRLEKLRFLHLGDLPWKEPPTWIAEVKGLEELWIASRTLERLPAEICKLPKLTRLHIWYSNLTAVPEELFGCTRLKELRIGNNPLPEATFERLRKALPHCTIY
jgi:hypothetical protein